jgi:hypothetical protein
MLQHYNDTLGLDIVISSPAIKFLLGCCCILFVELNKFSVGVEYQEMDFSPEGGYMLFFQTRQSNNVS